jgi:hypothetical protein
MKLYNRTIVVSIAVFVFGGIALCLAAAIGYSPVAHRVVGKHDLYIPQPYTRDAGFGLKGASIFDGFITTHYPGDAPLPAGGPDPDGKWSLKRIRIEFKDLDQIPQPYRDKGPAKFLEDRLRNSQAYHVLGEQYGLIHQEHPNNPDKVHKVHDEFWIERKDGALVSFIECDVDAPYPNCNQFFRDDKFSYQVFFYKIYLPEWSHIRANVIALMNSFRSEETALAYLAEQSSKIKTDEGDNNP